MAFTLLYAFHIAIHYANLWIGVQTADSMLDIAGSANDSLHQAEEYIFYAQADHLLSALIHLPQAGRS
jgi:hypothetical protein